MPKFLVLLLLLFATTARAETLAGEEAKACVPKGQTWSADHESENHTERWPREAAKLKGVQLNVSRDEDRLRLAIDGGRTVELQDCPYGDTGAQYLFERYDQPGRTYVVRTEDADDFFGREVLVDQLLNALDQGARLLALVDRLGAGNQASSRPD